MALASRKKYVPPSSSSAACWCGRARAPGRAGVLGDDDRPRRRVDARAGRLVGVDDLVAELDQAARRRDAEERRRCRPRRPSLGRDELGAVRTSACRGRQGLGGEATERAASAQDDDRPGAPPRAAAGPTRLRGAGRSRVAVICRLLRTARGSGGAGARLRSGDIEGVDVEVGGGQAVGGAVEVDRPRARVLRTTSSSWTAPRPGTRGVGAKDR